ncbi:MAG: hypothetical protein RIS70_4443 [Planctomycetota bacterium]
MEMQTKKRTTEFWLPSILSSDYRPPDAGTPNASKARYPIHNTQAAMLIANQSGLR